MQLFSDTLISPAVQKALPEGFVVRPLHVDDYDKGFLNALGMLTVIGPLTKSQFVEQFTYLLKHNHEYFTIVIEDTKKNIIVGAGTILVERKFVHMNGLVGHIEDIVTHKEYRGMNLGLRVIETLKFIGKMTGCYKIILDCSNDNVKFYEKCGFKQKEVEMVLYLPENDKSSKL